MTDECGFTNEQIALIKTTVAKGAPDDELKRFLYIAQKLGLDPLLGQIHVVERKQRDPEENWVSRWITLVGIDGYRIIADRSGRYAPGRTSEFVHDEEGNLVSATAYVKKLVGGIWLECSATAYFHEYVQKNRQGKPTRVWEQMPHGQLEKCAESKCLRRAFPELSGVYTEEEMEQASTPEPEPPLLRPQRKQPSAESPSTAPAPQPEPQQPESAFDDTTELRRQIVAAYRAAGFSDAEMRTYLVNTYHSQRLKALTAYELSAVMTAIRENKIAQEPEPSTYTLTPEPPQPVEQSLSLPPPQQTQPQKQTPSPMPEGKSRTLNPQQFAFLVSLLEETGVEKKYILSRLKEEEGAECPGLATIPFRLFDTVVSWLRPEASPSTPPPGEQTLSKS